MQGQKACGFKDGLQEGNCVQFYENGKKKEELVWKKGKLNGDAVFYHENGAIKASGKYKNSFKVDEWVYFNYKNVKVSKEVFKNGEKNIYRNELAATFFYPSGKVSSTFQMIDGKKRGEERLFFENGNIMQTSVIDKNSDTELTKMYDEKTQKLIGEGNVVDGERDGLWMYYNENEKWNGNYEKGARTGKWQTFYLSGKLKAESTFVNNEREGKRFLYKEDGTLEKTEIYKKGKLISSK